MPRMTPADFQNLVKGQDQMRTKKIPPWFQRFPSNAEKYFCRLHSARYAINQNQHSPIENETYCCPHVLRDIYDPNQPFNVIINNNHEFIIPFDQELASLMGTIVNDTFLLTNKDFESNETLIIKKLKTHKVVQSISTALRQAHSSKISIPDSFAKYDQIILHLAEQNGKLINEQIEKDFMKYEKLRNLALGTSEQYEKLLASTRAWDIGKRLISSLTIKNEESKFHCVRCRARTVTRPSVLYCDNCN